MYKKQTQINKKNTNHPIKKWAKDISRQLTEDEMQITLKSMKRWSSSLIIREEILNPFIKTENKM